MLDPIHSSLDIVETIREDHRVIATYRDIEAAIRLAVPSTSRAETLLASLRCWNSFSKTSLNCEVGLDLLRMTDDTKRAFLTWMLDEVKLAPSTGRKRIQHLSQISVLSQALVAVDKLPGSFRAALKALCSRFDQSIGRAATAVGVHKSTLAGWVKGHRPQHKHRETVTKLEAYFGVPVGTLTGRAEFLAPAAGKIRRTTFAQRRSEQCAASKEEGKLWIPFEYLQERWTKYLTFKTDEERPEVMYPANKSKPPVWRTKDPSACGIKPRSHMLLPNGKIVPSAGIAYGHIATYLGWRRREFGYTESAGASLAWLVDRQTVFKHAFWKAQRSRGTWHAGIKDFLAQVITMTRPHSGYLWQHHELAFELHEPQAVLGYPVIRGTAMVTSERSAFLWTSGFVPRLGTYMGPDTPNPLQVSIRRGEASLQTVMRDVLALSKINFNTCLFNDRSPSGQTARRRLTVDRSC